MKWVGSEGGVLVGVSETWLAGAAELINKTFGMDACSLCVGAV